MAFSAGAAKCVKQEGFPLFAPLGGWEARETFEAGNDGGISKRLQVPGVLAPCIGTFSCCSVPCPPQRSLGNGRLYLCEVPAAFADMRLQIQPSSGPGKGVGRTTYK